MKSNLAKDTLQKFEREREELPEFQNPKQEKIFLQLQKYNLLYVTPNGTYKITRKGEEALKGDVEKYLQLERFEARIAKDSLRRSTEGKWILFGIIPMVVILAAVLIFLQVL